MQGEKLCILTCSITCVCHVNLHQSEGYASWLAQVVPWLVGPSFKCVVALCQRLLYCVSGRLRGAGPFLDALDRTDYACEGTGFYALQSCLNHSCCPNAHAMKRDGDVPATCVILAKEPIQPSEEVLISYIDESADFSSRARELEDYGFVCKCAKCLVESKG